MLRFFTAFASLYFVSTLAHAQVIESQDKIRVRIFKARNEIFISGFGLRIQGEDLVIPNEILPKNKKLRVLRVPEGWSVTNISDPTQKDLYKGDRLRISGDLLKIENEAAAGDQLLIASGAKFDLISELDLEYYLKGVLPSEMPVQWPRESLKAQAVAARSYAMSIMAERSREPYHVDDTTHHQVFHLENYAGADLAAREKVEAAIAGTKGVYLTHSNGDPYKTFFHSDCGGSTEEPKFVWAVGEKNGTVKDER
ncbi:MAG: SpoIID/LytB domain-containing protein, partial [Bdellovibrionales bacterium]|nr:SpoIID/LytB domain-containing protein [Bdellovibrionales bacterium]